MEKKILALGATGKDDPNVLTVDSNAKLSPDVVHDLNQVPWPFKDNQFDSVICHHQRQCANCTAFVEKRGRFILNFRIIHRIMQVHPIIKCGFIIFHLTAI